MATDFSQLELNDDQRRLVASAAESLGLPWQEAFEQAFAPLVLPKTKTDGNGLAETPYAIMRRHGLIGCIQGTPADLSTNKKHMQGYGRNG